MRRRQPLPQQWMMTDERQGERLWAALDRLPRGAGVVFRHYTLGERERRDLFERVKDLAHRRVLLLMLGGSAEQAGAWGADGSHGRGPGEGLRSAPVHTLDEIRAAERDRAAFLFLSPVFSTRSHPDARPLGPAGFNRLARRTDLPVIALGGMDRIRARQVREAYGWAAIDAWARESQAQIGEGDLDFENLD